MIHSQITLILFSSSSHLLIYSATIMIFYDTYAAFSSFFIESSILSHYNLMEMSN